MPDDAQYVAQSVVRLARRLRHERHTDLTPNQLSLLGILRKHGPQSPSAIATRENVKPPTVTRTLNSLVREGLVRREPDAVDRRQVVVSLSDKGEAVLAEERVHRDSWLAQRLAELTPDERRLLNEAAAILDKLAQS
ncbi:MarR family transcriptional regulator [soil metagenome]